MEEEKTVLPPGLRFDPTDEELIIYFLRRRAKGLPCNPNIIPDLDIHASDPQDLIDDKAYRSNKGEWYFFSKAKKDRVAGKGIWKEVGFHEPIYSSDGNEIGVKNYLMYDDGSDRDRVVSNWTMEEYRLPTKFCDASQMEDVSEWVLCRVHGEGNMVSYHLPEIGDVYLGNNNEEGIELSYLDEMYLSLEDGGDDDSDDVVTSLN